MGDTIIERVQQILDQHEVGYVKISEATEKMVTLTCGDMDYRIMAGMVECEQKVPFITAYSIEEFLSEMHKFVETVRLIAELLSKGLRYSSIGKPCGTLKEGDGHA